MVLTLTSVALRRNLCDREARRRFASVTPSAFDRTRKRALPGPFASLRPTPCPSGRTPSALIPQSSYRLSGGPPIPATVAGFPMASRTTDTLSCSCPWHRRPVRALRGTVKVAVGVELPLIERLKSPPHAPPQYACIPCASSPRLHSSPPPNRCCAGGRDFVCSISNLFKRLATVRLMNSLPLSE